MPKLYSGSHRFRSALAIFTTLLLALVTLVATAPVSHADTPNTSGIKIDVLHNGVTIDDTSAIPEGDPILLRMQYDAAANIAGAEVTINLPSSLTITSELVGNEAIESVVQNEAGTVTVKFKDQIPSDVTEGALGIELQTAQVDVDQETNISWTIGDYTSGINFIIEDKVVPPVEVEDGYSKSVNPKNLNTFVERGVDDDGNYIFGGLKPEIKDQELTYTLVIDSSEARTNFLVKDVLPEGLSYVSDSFGAQLTVYDPEEATTPFVFDQTITGNSFVGSVTVPGNSSLRITYKVKVTDRAALEALLKAQFDELGLGNTGNYGINLTNIASFGDDGENDRTAGVQIRGNIPGVGVGSAFSKTGNWTNLEVVADEEGQLDPPVEMTYTFGANLKLWDERNPNFTLGQNVVISDELAEQATWKISDADFITAEGIALTKAETCPAELTDFVNDAFSGKWCVDEQVLLINVGKDNSENIKVSAKAQLNTVAGLTEAGDTTILGGTSYLWPNTAQFHYRDGNPYSDRHNAYPVVLPDDRDGGINDSSVFQKGGPQSDVRVSPGETAEVPYRFTINTSKDGIDPLNSKIVDKVNTEVFDITNPQVIPVSGSYGDEDLTAAHFALSLDAEGNLVVELSEDGKALISGLEEGETWIIDIVLTTVPFTGKETFEIYNKATLYGSGDDSGHWDDDTAEATSYGDEAELRKRVYDTETGMWTDEINVLIEDGQFVEDRFVYSIELIPRGNYGRDFPVQIFTRHDELPESVDFLGFVQLDDDGAPILDSFSFDTNEMNGNVIATYEEGIVTVEQKDGTNLNPNNGRIITYFAVQATDASESIVNRVVGSEARINPHGDPSVDIEKWNDEGSAPEYDESGALLNDGFDGDFDSAPGKPLAAGKSLEINFTVSNDGREDLVDVVVSDELTDGVGQIDDLVCVFPDESEGTQWAGPFVVGTQFECSGVLPALASGDTHSDTAKVTGVGVHSGVEVDDSDDWHGHVPVPSVDIEKWNDEGSAPEYDESGALLNDGFDGDFDSAPGKPLAAGKSLEINFTVSNDGREDLVDVVVSDELTDGVGQIDDLVCVFPDESEGTQWAGPFVVGTQFECSGVLPALASGDTHSDTAKVTGVGVHSGVEVDDSDDWHGHVPALTPTTPESGDGELSATGGTGMPIAIGTALLLLIAGSGALIVSRRNKVEA